MWTARVPIVRLVAICTRSKKRASGIGQRFSEKAKDKEDDIIIPAPASIYQYLIDEWL